MPHIEKVSKAVACFVQLLWIGVAHRSEAAIRRLVMRPKAPLSRGETVNVVYRVQWSSCEANYVREIVKRLQTRMGENVRAVRRMDELSLEVEHCVTSGHTFAFQNAEILGGLASAAQSTESQAGSQTRLGRREIRGERKPARLPAARMSPFTLAAWNVRSLLDNPRSNRPEWRMALVAQELARYKVDIASLSKIRFSEQGQLEDVGAGYTCFWSG
ncbi:unnamed protein product [Schistocephalus solidus]|uniref:Endo/exonuclease/phosphatase domain-containing protein n=1 Tax=Schistocephalus solidus TaxID=70667 RepID=A0A183T089_SCHSO|nr:unnamed protein product [Schistocephalus solidus]